MATPDDRAEQETAQPADPLAEWRHLPERPRPDQLVASKPVTPPRDAAEPAGDPGTEFMLRHAGG
ncbi:MAG TPA: hypothetical protein VHA75_00295 [Rugosimonospora sp.]|nr:hypothetical protein [Rugosimonospora sp.]